MVMPSSVMEEEQGNSGSASFFAKEIGFAEKKAEFWKPEAAAIDLKGSKSVFLSTIEKPHTVGAFAGVRTEATPWSCASRETSFALKSAVTLPSTLWGDAFMNAGSRPISSIKSILSHDVDDHAQFVSNDENGRFVSSVSEMFDKKARITSNGILGQSIGSVNSSHGEDEIFESMEEVDVQTIRDLLPDDDDLISGVLDDFDCRVPPTKGDDIDEDIFCVGGGMELEIDEAATGSAISDNSQLFAEHPYGELPSRTLFIRSISSNVEDAEIRALFQNYGDIHALHVSCKHCGLVKVSYYDLRAAQKAMKSLKNQTLGHRKLDIHFALPQKNHSMKDISEGTVLVSFVESSISNLDLLQICSAFGDIREIFEASNSHSKCIDFFDIRAAEAAFHALSSSDVSGKRFNVQLGHSKQWIMQEEQEVCNDCYQRRLKSTQAGNFGKVASRSLEEGVRRSLCSTVNPSVEKKLNSVFAGVPHKLLSPVKVGLVGQTHNGSVPSDMNHSLSSGLQGMSTHRPHSLSDYQNGLHNRFSYSPNSGCMKGAELNYRPEIDYGHAHSKLASQNFHGQSYDQNAAGFAICPLHGNQYLFDPSGMVHQNPMPGLWPNLSPNTPLHLHGYQRPSHIPCSIPLEQHHVGSAPVYQGNFVDVPAIHPGSLGCMPFPGSPQFYPMEVSQFHSFATPRGKCGDPLISSLNVSTLSPQQRSPGFHGRNSSAPLHTLHESPNERTRSRRHDSNGAHVENRKQYELDIDKIRRGEDCRTTLMIKNIPNKYTCKLLLQVVNENHRGTYDFFYLPIDFKNQCNVGYAFINMTDPKHIVPFHQTFNGRKWEKFNSEKVTMLAYARIQGRSALISHFQNSSLMNEDKRCRPMLFHADGPNAGEQEPFPVGSHVRSRSGRSRNSAQMENQVGSPLSSPIHEISDCGAESPSSSKDLSE